MILMNYIGSRFTLPEVKVASRIYNYASMTCPPVTGMACPVSPVWSMA